MAEKLYLGIDQGTTGTTILLLNAALEVVGRGYKKHRQIYPRPGWVEHDPEDIFNAILAGCQTAVKQAGASFTQIAGIGLDHQGETCAIWDKQTGKPLYNALVWQDRRTADYCDALQKEHGPAITGVTGLMPDAYFSASKIRWLLDNVNGARQLAAQGRLLAGTLDSYLMWHLSGGRAFATDPSSAGRTLLMDIRTCQWDATMLDLFDIPANILPPIMDTCDIRGHTDPDVLFGCRAPLCASLTDGCAALLGHGCAEPGGIKASYGTGCFIHMPVGNTPLFSKNRLIPSVPYKNGLQKRYLLGGNIYIAGAGIEWMQKELGLFKTPGQTQQMAQAVPNTNGVYIVPAFSGLGAPWWDQYARGLVIGLTGGVTRNHLVRAMLEGIALQVYDVVHTMQQEANRPITAMRADGGLVDNAFLMQFQADLLGIPVEVPQEKEMTAFGSAFLAALALGDYTELADARTHMRLKSVYTPQMSADERESTLREWHRAVSRSMQWIQQE